MNLLYAHLSDYAVQGAAGKLTFVGVFDTLFTRTLEGPIVFPACYLVANFACSLADGSDHQLEINLIDADDQPAGLHAEMPLQLRSTGPGYPLRAQIIVELGAGSLSVPTVGDYAIRFKVDGTDIGRLPLSVRPAPAA